MKKYENMEYPKELVKSIKEGKSLLKLKRFDDVEKLLEPYMYCYDDNLDLLNAIVHAYMINQEYEKAIPTLVRILELTQDDNQKNITIINLAMVLRIKDKANGAIKLLWKLLDQNNQNPVIYSELGLCYNKLNKPDIAEKHIIKSISLLKRDSTNRELVYLSAAEFYEDKQDFQKAIHYTEKALNTDPINMNGLQCMADCYFNMEKYDEAKPYYKKVLNYYPNTTQSNWALEQLTRCDEFK